jgi:5,10-methylenetetrahydrofolate reductase
MDTEDPLLRFVMVLREHAYQYSPAVLGITVPVIPGIMPIQAYASFLRVTKLCGTHIPDRIHEDLESIKVLPSNFPSILPPSFFLA